MSQLASALSRIAADLDSYRVPWALIGGLAVSVRSEPRTTRDVDVALVVAGDDEAEALVRFLVGRGYRFRSEGVLEQRAAQRMATVRLETPGQEDWGVVVDLMFASSGIEAEVIARARPVEVFENVTAPVASRGHLIALKVLAGRKRDEVDALGLISWASPRELDHAREALELITERGYHRDRDLLRILETWVRDVDPS